MEALEASRQAEEELRERRRLELLGDENGYWRQRMMMEARAAEAAVAVAAEEDDAKPAPEVGVFFCEPEPHHCLSPALWLGIAPTFGCRPLFRHLKQEICCFTAVKLFFEEHPLWHAAQSC